MKQILLSFLAISFLFIACNKDDDEPQQPQVKDRMELLTSVAWQIDHLYQVQGGQKAYYDRGGSNNTYNYGSDLLKFNTDGSGTYTTSAGNSYTIEWQFDNAGKTEISYTINGFPNGSLDIKLENVFLDENNFRYAEMYTNNGLHTGGSVYRTPGK
ncbi:MAG: hypothetical protein JNK79_12665 [Chitinophagaceae bacterium]|nr:hypothetical protein [Chitinophagaceae bacterium]